MRSSASSRKTKRVETVSTSLEVVGLILVAVAMALVAPWLGLAVAGVECVIAGLALSMQVSRLPDLPGDGA